MSLVMSICDNVVALDFGRKIAEGTPAQVQNDDGRDPRLSRDHEEMSKLLEAQALCAYLRRRRRCCSASSSTSTRAASRRCSAPTAPARPRRCARSPACAAPRARSASRASDRRPRHRGHRAARHRACAGGARHLRAPDRRGKSPDRRDDAARPQGDRRRRRARLRLFSAPEGTPPPAGRHALGRRAADARGRARPDAAPAPDAARRALVRPRAADRGGAVRHPAHAQRRPKRSACCWSSRTPRSRSISPTTPI